ncbi:hypothetical protein ACP4OV_008998 [Aristida adscensionis]
MSLRRPHRSAAPPLPVLLFLLCTGAMSTPTAAATTAGDHSGGEAGGRTRGVTAM